MYVHLWPCYSAHKLVVSGVLNRVFLQPGNYPSDFQPILQIFTIYWHFSTPVFAHTVRVNLRPPVSPKGTIHSCVSVSRGHWSLINCNVGPCLMGCQEHLVNNWLHFSLFCLPSMTYIPPKSARAHSSFKEPLFQNISSAVSQLEMQMNMYDVGFSTAMSQWNIQIMSFLPKTIEGTLKLFTIQQNWTYNFKSKHFKTLRSKISVATGISVKKGILHNIKFYLEALNYFAKNFNFIT